MKKLFGVAFLFVLFSHTADAAIGTIQGYKVDVNGQPFNSPGAALLIPGPGWVPASYTVGVSTNPYSISVPYNSTGYAMLTSIPDGYTAYYSACVNCIAHPSESFTKGSAAYPLIPPAEGFIDLWWKYVPAPAGPVTKIIDSLAGGFYYAYAPTIVKQNGMYHAFFCSYGDPNAGVDYLRYANSTDGQHWSTPVVKVKSTAYQNMKDLAACDPNVVYYQGYYYLFYSSALYYPTPTNGRTVIQIARSQTIDGQYLTYTDRGTWEDTPTDPKVILYSLVKDAGGYGAGQQQVVVRGNKLLMWYSDDSLGQGVLTYMLESTDPLQWTPGADRVTNIPGGAPSPDIKFDPASSRFVMSRIINSHTANSSLAVGTSLDGLNWSYFATLIPESSFPNFANNNGMAGDALGNLLSGPVLIAFAAPAETDRIYDLWGYWDLYGVTFDSTVLATSTNPPSCTSVGPQNVTTTATTGTLNFYAYGVRDATSVSFPTWSVVNGQDDIIWYPGTDLGNGTWKGTIDLSKHRPGNPDYGTIAVHVWLFGTGGNVFCGAADFTRNIQGDLNCDGSVDIIDLSFIASHFGQTNAHPLWNATADVISDNEIDVYDVVFVAGRFG